MSFETFIEDLRQIQAAEDLKGGKRSLCNGINAINYVTKLILEAANRNGAGGGADGLPAGTFQAYINDGGEPVLYNLVGGPAT